MDTQTILILAIFIPTLAFLYKALFSKPSLPLPPGPRGLPVLGSLLQVGPRPHTSLLALAHAYGPIMHLRMASIPTIVVSDSACAELFLKMHDAPFANRPPSETFRILSYNFRSFAFTEQGPYWRHVRKLCIGQLLCGPKIASFRSSRQEEVELLVRRVEAKAAAREEVDVSEVLAAAVADVVCRMILGKKYMTEGKEGVRFREKTRELMELMSEFNVNDFIPALGFLDLQGVKKRMKAVHEEFDAFMEKIVDEHLEEGRGRRKEGGERDFVDVMLGFVEAGEEVEGIKFDRTSVKAIVLVSLKLIN